MRPRFRDIAILAATLLALNFLGPTALVLSVPFAFMHRRLDTPTRWIGAGLAFAVFSMVPEPPLVHYVNLLHFLALTVPALVFIESREHGYPIQVSLTASVSVLIAAVFLGWLMAPTFLENGLFEGLLTSLTRMGLNVPEDSRRILTGLSGLMPGFLAISEGMFLVLNLYLFQRITGEHIHFRSFEVPFAFLPAYSLLGVLYLLSFHELLPLGRGETWLAASLIACAFFLFLQGLAVIVSFVDRPGIPPFFRWVTYGICLIHPGPILVTLLGIMDLWFHFRNRLAIMPENGS